MAFASVSLFLRAYIISTPFPSLLNLLESNITFESDTKYTKKTEMAKTDTTIIKWTLSEIKANR